MILFLTNHNTFIMLCLLIPKLFLELLSLIRYLLAFNIVGFYAQLLSYVWILFHPAHILNRIYYINKIKKKSLLSIIKKMHFGSIAFDYFVLGKKKYSNFEK